jgi:N-acetylglucosaminyl-diphospho-decaprenol L-rhamnosyltransferase
MVLLSIIIVAYKSREEIEACLVSLPLRLQERPVEIIVVDNSPSDGIGTLIASRFEWVRYVDPGVNLGFGRANNLGYTYSSGDFVLFLNPDTVCNVRAIEHCISRLQSDRSIGLISPKLIQGDGAMDQACRRSIPTLWDGFCRATGLAAKFPGSRVFAGYNLTHLPEDGTYDVGAINGAFMMVSREVLGHVGTFDEAFFMYGDDLDLCIRVARAGWRVIYDGRIQIVHLKGTSVAKDYQAMSRAIFDANRDVYLKHFNPRRSLLVRWKYQFAFGLWKQVALMRAKWRGHRRVKPI